MRARSLWTLATALPLFLTTSAHGGDLDRWESARNVRNAGRVTTATGIGIAVFALPVGYVAGGVTDMRLRATCPADEVCRHPNPLMAGAFATVVTLGAGIVTGTVGGVMWSIGDRNMWREEQTPMVRKVNLGVSPALQPRGGGLVLNGTF